MAIVEDYEFHPLNMIEDPDDYRPDSKLAIVIDPGDTENGYVDQMSVFTEKIGIGDAIPFHLHHIEEIMQIQKGSVEVRLGNQRKKVSEGAVVFIPAGVPHGIRNTGADVARIFAVFPSREIDIRYLERNPAPGTEDDEPAPPISIDVREFLTGDPEKAIRPYIE
ncbi:cupin domain-containing protein [Robertkochia solimangrovi]|uniref:cupin domain-containing protein n=1 Tax=Robertkochia solimangrovi TaxID=2213046 RepID=UPI00117FD2EB|nr:cupin domain-containing protein [Robertkochia solimangrovi]TRZ44333.1 hypothetical protein DMZ48_07425 [Robertkochia solimangrovi]